ncbi:MAG: hypothetical protein KAU50_09435 [Candidatus Marinimicrobia bacterium]|nr:hypothetical protein [Candidatus Neomarinimicrobiota bacterium]
MGINFQDLIEFVRYILPRRKTKSGFFGILVVGILILRIIASSYSIPVQYEVLTFFIFGIIWHIIWLFLSGRRAIPSNKIVIAFALRSENYKSQRIIDSAISRIKDRLNIIGLLETIKITQIGSDIFSTKEEAEHYVKKRNFFLVIYGTVYRGTINDSYRYDMRNFFFSYLAFNAPRGSDYFGVIQNDIKLMLANRDWIISESNEIPDIEKVSNELFESALSIISITLARSLEHIEIAIQLINFLLPALEQGIPPEERVIKIPTKSKKVKLHLNLIKSGRLRAILGEIHIGLIRYYGDEADYDKVIYYAEQGLRIGADPVNCYSGMAIASFYQGDIERAKKYTVEINKKAPNHPLYLVNSAFFAIRDKEYIEAINSYNLLRKDKKVSQEIIYDVITFLAERFAEQSKEFGYLYGQAILTFNYVSKKNGRSLLSDFLEKAQGHNEYEDMVDLAQKLCK